MYCNYVMTMHHSVSGHLQYEAVLLPSLYNVITLLINASLTFHLQRKQMNLGKYSQSAHNLAR